MNSQNPFENKIKDSYIGLIVEKKSFYPKWLISYELAAIQHIKKTIFPNDIDDLDPIPLKTLMHVVDKIDNWIVENLKYPFNQNDLKKAISNSLFKEDVNILLVSAFFETSLDVIKSNLQQFYPDIKEIEKHYYGKKVDDKELDFFFQRKNYNDWEKQFLRYAIYSNAKSNKMTFETDIITNDYIHNIFYFNLKLIDEQFKKQNKYHFKGKKQEDNYSNSTVAKNTMVENRDKTFNKSENAFEKNRGVEKPQQVKVNDDKPTQQQEQKKSAFDSNEHQGFTKLVKDTIDTFTQKIKDEIPSDLSLEEKKDYLEFYKDDFTNDLKKIFNRTKESKSINDKILVERFFIPTLLDLDKSDIEKIIYLWNVKDSEKIKIDVSSMDNGLFWSKLNKSEENKKQEVFKALAKFLHFDDFTKEKNFKIIYKHLSFITQNETVLNERINLFKSLGYDFETDEVYIDITNIDEDIKNKDIKTIPMNDIELYENQGRIYRKLSIFQLMKCQNIPMWNKVIASIENKENDNLENNSTINESKVPKIAKKM